MGLISKLSCLLLCGGLVAGLAGTATLSAQETNGSATPPASLDSTPASSSLPRFGIFPIGDYENGWFEVTLEPGSSVPLTLGIGNSGEVPTSLLTYVANATNGPNGGFEAGAAEEELVGPALWIDFESEALTLEPEEVVQRDFVLSIPADVQPGEYVIALVAQTAESVEIPGNDVLRQFIRSAVSVEITVPGEMRTGFELGQPVISSTGSEWILDVPITNTGTARVRPAGELVVTTPSDEVVSSTVVEMGSVYGGNTTSVRVSLPAQLPLGEYLVSLDLTDEATGASASVSEVPVTLAESEAEAPETFVVDVVSVTPNADPIQYADVAATITNNGPAIPTANVTLVAYRDGETVESYPLAANQALAQGTTEFTQRYIPIEGWQPGTWTFELVVSAVSGGTETVLATVEVADEITVP
jgi:hypothetical protein